MKRVFLINIILLVSYVLPAQILNNNPGFETGNWSNEWRHNNGGHSTSEVEIVTAPHPVRSGNYALRLKTQVDYRNEVIMNDGSDVGKCEYDKEYWYGTSMYLVNYSSSPQPSWSTIIQMHSVPGNFNWGTCCSGRNGWTLRSIGDELVIYSEVHDDPFEIPTRCAASGNADRSWRNPISNYENKWVDVVIHFRLSTGSSGFIQWWIDGELVVDISGPNVLHYDLCGVPRERFCYLQTGIYKEKASTNITRELYLDEIRMGDASATYEDVAPNGNRPNNSSPILSPVGDHNVLEENAINISLSAIDYDNDALSYSVTPDISFITLTDNQDGSGSLRIEPITGDQGTYNLTVTVTDIENNSDLETISIIVESVADGNVAPVLDRIGDKRVTEGNTINIPLNSNDNDGDGLAYSTEENVSFATLTDNGDGTGNISLSPQFGDAGFYRLRVIVTDVNNNSDNERFNINVDPAGQNVANPDLFPVGNQYVSEGAVINVPLDAISPYGDSLRFSISPNLDFLRFSAYYHSFANLVIAPTTGDAGTYSVTITVRDENGGVDSETINIIVNQVENGNNLPVLDHIQDQLIYEGESLNVDLSSTDLDGDVLSYSIYPQLEFINLIDYGDGNGMLEISPITGHSGKYYITITVQDSNNGEDTRNFELLVQDLSNFRNSNVINSGGSSMAAGSMLLQEDKYFQGGSSYSYNATAIENTDIDELYNSVRFGNFNYEIPVYGNGLYSVRLYFAEVHYQNGAIGKRVFNVDIEDKQEHLINYDINADAGPLKAVTKTFTGIEVEDGFISVSIKTVVDVAILSGIEIINETNSVTKIENEELDYALSIYPNPSESIFRVEILSKNVKSELPIVIYDIAGKIIYRSIMEGNSKDVDLSGKKSGVYILKVGNSIVEKLFLY